MTISTFAHRSLPAILLVWSLALQASSVSPQQARPELIPQIIHTGLIRSMVFSPDGRMIATAGSDHTVKLWDATRGMLIRNLEGHTGEVRSVAFSANGQHLISAGHDSNVRVWEVATGRMLRVLALDPQSWAGGAAFAEDGNSVVVAGRASEAVSDSRAADRLNELGVWNLQTGRKVRSVKTNGYCDPVRFSDDRSLAVCGPGELWDLSAMKRLNDPAVSMRMDSASFSPNGNLMALVSFYGLDVWDVKRMMKVRAIRLSRSPVLTSAAFSPDGMTIAAADESGRVGLWDASSGEIRGEMVDSKSGGEASALAFSPDGKTLLLATAGKPLADISVWSLDGGLPPAGSAFYAANRGSGGATAAVIDNAARAAGAAVPRGSVYGVSAVRFSPDGRTLAAGGADQMIRLWNLQSGQLARTLRGSVGAIRNLAFSPDGSSLASTSLGGGEGKGLRLWDVRTGAATRVFADAGLVNAVIFHSDGRTIVAGGSTRFWDMSSDQLTRRIPMACDFLGMSPDGNIVACAWEPDRLNSNKQVILLVDPKSGKELKKLSGHDDRITSASFTADSSRLVTASVDKTIKVWDLKTGGLTSTLTGHGGPVLSVAVNPAGLLIASGSADGTIKLWDARGRVVNTLNGHTNSVTSVAFGPEGMTLASGSEDGTVRIWSPSQGTLLATLMSFGEDEWIAYGPEGHYTGSSDRARYVAWRIGNTVYDFDQFFERFYTPDLLVRVFQGAAPPATEAPGGNASPPDVVIVSPRPGQMFRDPDIDVTVEVKDTGGGISGIRLSLNGKQVDSSAATRGIAPTAQGSSQLKYHVSLLEGANVLRASAFSSDRTESAPHEMTVRLGAPVKEATLRLLAIGISRYQNQGLALTFPTADVRDLVSFFKTSGPRLFREVDVTELADEAATQANILQALVALQRRAQPQDVVVVFLSGHGASAGTNWYFIPQDLRNPEQQDELPTHALSSERLAQELRRVSSQKVLLLVDSCYSGSMLSAFRGFEDRKALALLARSAGIHILAAATRDQRASEIPELGHGVFSYALLRGLSGGAALRDVDKQVTVNSLVAYIRDQLPDLGRKYQAEVQDPVSFSNGMDFPIAITR